MAYTNGIFRIDLVSGSDAARTALTSCTASNPSGTITRINKTGHGLVTGAVVDLTLFSAWLNDAWKITVVDADNFDLDGAVWQATADTSGTVTPRGGSSWSDAWLTINSGATAARIQPGDQMRIAKTAEPVSLGQNATWTDGSQTVTLTTAVTKKIEDAVSGWTAATNITAGTSTNRKFGATAVLLTPAAGFTTGKMAYAAISGGGAQDFSAYQYINFWWRSNSFAAMSDFKICLCSDATGDTIVNEIAIPSTVATGQFFAMSLNYGAALSSSVQSVAIYATADPGTNAISINNIFASTGDISLKTLIGKTGDVNYNIQSIDGTTIKIDSNNTAATGRGYSGTTSTETLYYRVPFDVTTVGTWQTINESGDTISGYTEYSGGWNTSTGLRDGQTVIGSTLIGTGSPIQPQSRVKISNFTFARFGSITQVNNLTLENCVWCGGGAMHSNTGNNSGYYKDFKILNSSGSIVLGGIYTLENCSFLSCATTGATVYAGNKFLGCVFANNGTSSVSMNRGSYNKDLGYPIFRNCIFSDSSEVTGFSGFDNGFLWSFDHDNTQGNHWGFSSSSTTINWQTTTKQGSDPGAWKFVLSSSTRGTNNPATMKIAEVACNASSLVTVKAWVKKDHATNVGAKLYVEDAAYNIAGVVATSATKASDTNWEELTVTFTPTENGVVPIFVDAWYVAGASNVYVGSITVTQA